MAWQKNLGDFGVEVISIVVVVAVAAGWSSQVHPSIAPPHTPARVCRGRHVVLEHVWHVPGELPRRY